MSRSTGTFTGAKAPVISGGSDLPERLLPRKLDTPVPNIVSTRPVTTWLPLRDTVITA